jgi:hypothetical protein
VLGSVGAFAFRQCQEYIMCAEISFDTIIPVEGTSNIEGCFRLAGEDWQVFYFCHDLNGQVCVGPARVRRGTWRSGITGVQGHFPRGQVLDKILVCEILSEILGVHQWIEVQGPDSLELK